MGNGGTIRRDENLPRVSGRGTYYVFSTEVSTQPSEHFSQWSPLPTAFACERPCSCILHHKSLTFHDKTLAAGFIVDKIPYGTALYPSQRGCVASGQKGT